MMNEEQIRQLVLEAIADLHGSNGKGAPSAVTTSRAQVSEVPLAYPKVITQTEVREAAEAGRTAILAGPGTLVTPLARELAEEKGIAITTAGANQGGGAADVGCVSGSSYCIECGACVQPAFYERRPWPLASDLDALIQRVQQFTLQAWPAEPSDVRRLREIRKPPMGNLPCVFYANANLFWSGENIQVARELAKTGSLDLRQLNSHLAATLTRHAARLSKWELTDTIGLIKDVVSFLEQGGAEDVRSFTYLCEQLMIALDRVQSWVDRMIPWNDLDRGVALRPLM